MGRNTTPPSQRRDAQPEGSGVELFACADCGNTREVKRTAKGAKRRPNGWKSSGDKLFCAKCWGKHYFLRAITMTVASPVGHDWPDLRRRLSECWAASTRLANWAVTELAKADVIRVGDSQNLGPMPYIYLYQEARKRFPELPPKCVVATLHNVEQRYRRARLAVMWRAEASLQRFRYPMPYTIPLQGWKAYYGEDNVPLVDLHLGDEHYTLRLSAGPNNRRQLSAFAKIVSGAAVPAEVALYRKRASSGDHRPCVEDREPAGGQRALYRIMVKLVAWLPRPMCPRPRTGVLDVRTESDAFLVAFAPDREPWKLNADHVRRWIMRHRRLLDRVAEDTKHEKRWPKRIRRQLDDYRTIAVERHNRRMQTFCHQAAAMVAGYAERLGVAEVQFNATDKGYFSSFPWYVFQEMLQTKLNERSIQFSAVPDKQDSGSDQRLAA